VESDVRNIEATIVDVDPVTGCGLNTNGSAEVSGAGGDGPYSFQWNDDQSQTTAMATGLAAGTYHVIVTDANGCTETALVSVPAENEPVTAHVTESRMTVTCDSMSDGFITLCIEGGTAPYTTSMGTIDSSHVMIENLAAGNYSTIITDDAGCSMTYAFDILPSGLSLILQSAGTTCTGCADGSITIDASGGVAPYLFSWTPSNGNPNGMSIENLTTGSYFVCITDSNNCMLCDSVSVLEDPLSVNTLYSGSGFLIYPNPATTTSTLKYIGNSSTPPTLILYDVRGLRLQIQTGFELPLEGLGLSAGVYFVTVIEGEDEVGHVRVVVPR
jgi:hypothetical protein